MKRLKVIACEIAFRELCFCASQVSTIVDFAFLTKGLHDMGAEKMRITLQQEIDKVDVSKYDAILLAYGLCSCGVVGLVSELPLVIPKAHDRITFFLGSKERYSEFIKCNTGSYIYSPGWIEREIDPADIPDGITTQLGMNKTYDEYVEEFGEDNAEFIMEMLGGYEKLYDKIVFINTKVGDVEHYRAKLQEKAESSNWIPLEIEGNSVFENPQLLFLLFCPLLLFFVLLFIVGQMVGRLLRFEKKDIIALDFTTLARNSPLALAIAVATFPEYPLISLSLIIGPLIELPILSIISGVLLKWNEK